MILNYDASINDWLSQPKSTVFNSIRATPNKYSGPYSLCAFSVLEKAIEEAKRALIFHQCGSSRSLCWEMMMTRDQERACWMKNQMGFFLSRLCRYCLNIYIYEFTQFLISSTWVFVNFRFYKTILVLGFDFAENLCFCRVFCRWSSLYDPGTSICSLFFIYLSIVFLIINFWINVCICNVVCRI